MLAAANIARDQAGHLQDGHVTRDACEAHRQRVRQIGDARVAASKRDKQGPAGRIRKRRVRPIEDLIFNRYVDHPGSFN